MPIHVGAKYMHRPILKLKNEYEFVWYRSRSNNNNNNNLQNLYSAKYQLLDISIHV